YSGPVNLTCPAVSGMACNLSPSVVNLSGSAQSVTASIPVSDQQAPGTYDFKITANDGRISPAPSANGSLTITNFTVSASQSQTVKAGTAASYQLTIAPGSNGYTGNISLSCSNGVPALAACQFSLTSVIPHNSAVTVNLSITTTAATVSHAHPG